MLNIKITKDIILDFYYKKISKIGKIAILVIILFSIMIFFLGYIFHPIPNPATQEVDQYIYIADDIRAGIMPIDKWRPLFYPILTAFFGNIFKDSFIGGRFVSQISAIFLLIFSYLLFKKVFNSVIALTTIIILSINFDFFINGVYVATEMLFATLTFITIYFLILLVERFSYKRLILLSLFFSLSYFTRYTAVVLVPVVIIGIIFVTQKGLKLKINYILIFLGLSIFFLLPHFIITTYNFGNPFYNENWKNLAFKLYGEGNWAYLWSNDIPFNGLFSVISNNPKLFLLSGIKEFYYFFKQCGIISRILMLKWYLFTVLFLIGTFKLIINFANKQFFKSFISKSNFLIILFIYLYILLISFTFFSFIRFVFVILPFIYVLIIYAVFSFGRNIKIFDKIELIHIYLIVLCLILQLCLFYNRLIVEYKSLPINEFKAAEELQKKYGKDINVLYTTIYLEKFVDYNCIRHWGQEKDYNKDLILFFKKINLVVNMNKIQFIIIGKDGFSNFLKQLLINKSTIPSFLEILDLSTEYAVFKVKNQLYF